MMKMKYKKVMDLSSRNTKFFKHLLSSMKNTLHTEEKKSHDVFTLPSHALPSQYRTLLPVQDVEIERLLTLERRRRIIRNATLAVASIIIVFIIIVITLIIVLQLSLDKGGRRGPLRLTAVHVNRTQFHVDEIKLLKTKAMVKSSNVSQKISNSHRRGYGIQCIATCWEYAAFRFKAECVNGQCLCRDKNYDSFTCLPKTSDCTIRRHRHHPSFQAIHQGQVQTSYSCAPKKEVRAETPKKEVAQQTDSAPEIHVISIYGNNRDIKLTRLHFKSSEKINVSLVLVSYEPVTWNITLDGSVHTENIYLISHYGVSRTQVRVASHPNRAAGNGNASVSHTNDNATSSSSRDDKTKSSTEATSAIPAHNPNPNHIQITRLLIRTGYGDDRDSGSTPFLLEQITTKIGSISSFFGVARADDIEFDIGLGNYELSPTSEEERGFYRTTYET